MADDTQEKTHDASQRKLTKAREKGQLASSADFASTSVFVVGVIVVAFSVPDYVRTIAAGFFRATGGMGRVSPHEMALALIDILTAMGGPLVQLLVLSSAAGVAANIVHKGGLVVSFEPVAPKFSHLDPGEGFKRMLGMRSWVDLGAALARSLIWLGVTIVAIWLNLPGILAAATCGGACVFNVGYSSLWWLFVLGLLLIVASAIVDLPVQVMMFLREMKMSRREVKEEHKESEGSPEFRQTRRAAHRGLAATGLARASFVLISASVAIALRFDKEDAPVPICVAKGRDENADRIVDAARQSGIPVEADPELAARLAKSVAAGDPIPAREFPFVAAHLVRLVPEALA